MSLIDLFLDFIDKILNFEILSFPLYDYLFVVTILVIAFGIINKMIHSKE